MKRLLLLILLLLPGQGLLAQNTMLGELTAKGKKVYIEFVDIHDNIPQKEEQIVHALNHPNWARWEIVKSPAEADFILHIDADKSGVTGYMGAKLYLTPYIKTLDGNVVWTGSQIVGKASPYTGYRAYWQAAARLVDDALLVELQNDIKGIPNKRKKRKK